VRGCAVLNSPRAVDLQISVCKLLNTTEGALGLPIVRLLPAGRHGVLRLVGQTLSRHHPRKGPWREASGSGGTDTDSGVPASDKESVRGRRDSVKALRGTDKDQGEFVSSALKIRRTSGTPES
jgi:hypothetical protein